MRRSAPYLSTQCIAAVAIPGLVEESLSEVYVSAIVLSRSRRGGALWSSGLRQLAHRLISTGVSSEFAFAGQTCRVISSPGRPQARQQ
jgi:hypothetical protein